MPEVSESKRKLDGSPEAEIRGMPEYLLPGLRRYRDQRIPTGGFLRAVLENNLVEATRAADAENQRKLPEIVSWCYNNLPSVSWGSKERVKEWLEAARPNSQT